MRVYCPYCWKRISLKSAKKGRYTPECPRCHQQFLLSVSSDSTTGATAAPLPDKKPSGNATSIDPMEATLGGSPNMSAPDELDSLVGMSDEDWDSLASIVGEPKTPEAPKTPKSRKRPARPDDDSPTPEIGSAPAPPRPSPAMPASRETPPADSPESSRRSGEKASAQPPRAASGQRPTGPAPRTPAAADRTQPLDAAGKAGGSPKPSSGKQLPPKQKKGPPGEHGRRFVETAAKLTATAGDFSQTAPLAPDISSTPPPSAPAAPLPPGNADGVSPGQPEDGPPPNGARVPPPARSASGRASRTFSGAPQATAVSRPHDQTIALVSDIPQILAGYRILRRLGEGGMGAVYLARQLSLQRMVALKTIRSEWANNPVHLARFTREAYAAAQLVHPNVAQIYDMGEDQGIHFFSMEYINGPSLYQVVLERGHLEPDVAAGYVLQAARGLKYAHSLGMVHRDVKPENLMLDPEGVVKVVDLGLVKTADPEAPPAAAADATMELAVGSPSGNLTQMNIAIGSPNYMAPEQAENAAGVDQRADIYSLGCTLYVLLTGQPPFHGASVIEVITKHKTEKVVRPEVIVEHLPEELSDITLRMMAKRAEDRYADLDVVIGDLQEYLGLERARGFVPREQQIEAFQASARAFQNPGTMPVRPLAMWGLSGVWLVLLAFGVLSGRPSFFGSVAGLGLMTLVNYFVARGALQKDVLFRKVCGLIGSGGRGLWITAGSAVLAAGTLLWVFDLLWPWTALFGWSALLAAALYFGVDRRLAAGRKRPLEEIHELLRILRARGVGEEDLREFVAKQAGQHWEELYEALFGYEEKIAARAKWRADQFGQPRPKFAAWRDRLIAWFDARIEAARQARQRKHLLKVEQNKLLAEGFSAQEARYLANNAADLLVKQAAEVRQAGDGKLSEEAAKKRRDALKEMLYAARAQELHKYRTRFRFGDQVRKAATFLFGQRARCIAGCALLVLGALWVHQNVGENGQPLSIELAWLTSGETDPLYVPLVPWFLTSWINFLNIGVAGLILLFSSLVPRRRGAIFGFAAAGVVLIAHSLVALPAIAGFAPHVTSMAIGATMAVLAYLYAWMT